MAMCAARAIIARMTMDCWTTPDDGILVRLESPDGCSSETGDAVWILLDPWHDVAHVWRDDSELHDDAEDRLTHEVEGSTFVAVVEERFEAGRANFSREVEIEDLVPLEPEEAPPEEEIRRRFARYRG